MTLPFDLLHGSTETAIYVDSPYFGPIESLAGRFGLQPIASTAIRPASRVGNGLFTELYVRAVMGERPNRPEFVATNSIFTAHTAHFQSARTNKSAHVLCVRFRHCHRRALAHRANQSNANLISSAVQPIWQQNLFVSSLFSLDRFSQLFAEHCPHGYMYPPVDESSMLAIMRRCFVQSMLCAMFAINTERHKKR